MMSTPMPIQRSHSLLDLTLGETNVNAPPSLQRRDSLSEVRANSIANHFISNADSPHPSSSFDESSVTHQDTAASSSTESTEILALNTLLREYDAISIPEESVPEPPLPAEAAPEPLSSLTSAASSSPPSTETASSSSSSPSSSIVSTLAPGFSVDVTTPLDQIQEHANTISAEALQNPTQAVLHEMIGMLEMRFPGQPVTVTSTLADQNGLYKLGVYAAGDGTKCYKTNASYTLSVGGPPPECITVNQTIFTNVACTRDSKAALETLHIYTQGILEMIKPAADRSRLTVPEDREGSIMAAKAFNIKLSKDATGKPTGLSSFSPQGVTGVTFGLTGTPSPVRFSPQGKPFGQQATYGSEIDWIREGAPIVIEGMHEVEIEQIRYGKLSLEKFLQDIKEKEGNLDKTVKNSFMRFYGVFGKREHSDVANYRAFPEAYGAVQRVSHATPRERLDSTRWLNAPKVKAYVDAYNREFEIQESRDQEISRLQGDIENLRNQGAQQGIEIPAVRDSLREINPRRTLAENAMIAARDEVENLETQIAKLREKAYVSAESAVIKAQEEVENLTTQIAELRQTIGYDRYELERLEGTKRQAESQLSHYEAQLNHLTGDFTSRNGELGRLLNEKEEAEERLSSCEEQFVRIEAEYNGLKNNLTRLEREIQGNTDELQRAQNHLDQVQTRWNSRLQDAQSKRSRWELQLQDLHGEMSGQIEKVRKERHDLVEKKQTIDGMIASPTVGAVALTANEINKLQQASQRLERREADLGELFTHLGV